MTEGVRAELREADEAAAARTNGLGRVSVLPSTLLALLAERDALAEQVAQAEHRTETDGWCRGCERQVAPPVRRRDPDEGEPMTDDLRAEFDRVVRMHSEAHECPDGSGHTGFEHPCQTLLLLRRVGVERDALAERWKLHEVANGGCVPGDAYRDVSDRLARAEQREARVRAVAEQLRDFKAAGFYPEASAEADAKNAAGEDILAALNEGDTDDQHQ